jgi:hypothetical protein
MTFVAGAASDVFPADFAGAVDVQLRKRFPALAPSPTEEWYRSEEVDATGWSSLVRRYTSACGKSAQLGPDPYQAVYLPLPIEKLEQVIVPPAADPIQAGSLPALIAELRAFAAKASLPTDDLELMQLAAKYLEDDVLIHKDLDVQTYLQLMLSAKQAAAHDAPLWVAIS